MNPKNFRQFVDAHFKAFGKNAQDFYVDVEYDRKLENVFDTKRQETKVQPVLNGGITRVFIFRKGDKPTLVKPGVARCSDSDRFERVKGRNLAFRQAFEKLKRAENWTRA